MTGRTLGCALLFAGATVLLCPTVTRAEEGPILPGLDAIPESPPYVANPPASDVAPRPRRTMRPAAPRQDVERERSSTRDDVDRPVHRDESSPAAQTPSTKRSGIRGLLPERPTDRPPIDRNPGKPQLDRANPLGRAQDALRGTTGKPNDVTSQRRTPSDSRLPERGAIGDRREPLADPWGASRPQTDPRTRATLEREKAWRAGQNAPPAGKAYGPPANFRSSSRAPQSGRQSGKQAPSPRTGQPNGDRFAR